MLYYDRPWTLRQLYFYNLFMQIELELEYNTMTLYLTYFCL